MRKRGEEHPNRTLTEKTVQRIRRMYWCNNMLQRELAAIFNVKQPTISDVVNYKQWAHVEDDFRADEIRRT